MNKWKKFEEKLSQSLFLITGTQLIGIGFALVCMELLWKLFKNIEKSLDFNVLVWWFFLRRKRCIQQLQHLLSSPSFSNPCIGCKNVLSIPPCRWSNTSLNLLCLPTMQPPFRDPLVVRCCLLSFSSRTRHHNRCKWCLLDNVFEEHVHYTIISFHFHVVYKRVLQVCWCMKENLGA